MEEEFNSLRANHKQKTMPGSVMAKPGLIDFFPPFPPPPRKAVKLYTGKGFIALGRRLRILVPPGVY